MNPYELLIDIASNAINEYPGFGVMFIIGSLAAIWFSVKLSQKIFGKR